MTPPLGACPCGPPTRPPVPLFPAGAHSTTSACRRRWMASAWARCAAACRRRRTRCTLLSLCFWEAGLGREWRMTAQQASEFSHGSSSQKEGSGRGWAGRAAGGAASRPPRTWSAASQQRWQLCKWRSSSGAAPQQRSLGTFTRLGHSHLRRRHHPPIHPARHLTAARLPALPACLPGSAGVQGLRLQDHGRPGQAGLPHEAGCAHQRPRAGAQAEVAQGKRTPTSCAFRRAAAPAARLLRRRRRRRCPVVLHACNFQHGGGSGGRQDGALEAWELQLQPVAGVQHVWQRGGRASGGALSTERAAGAGAGCQQAAE